MRYIGSIMGETRTQVNLRIDEEQKGEWEAYVEDSGEYSNLSHLIRTAVERERMDSGRPTRTGEGPDRTGEVLERLGRVEARVIGIAEQVQAVEATLTDEPPEVKDLAAEIFDFLPSYESEKQAVESLGTGVHPETGERGPTCNKRDIIEAVDDEIPVDRVTQAVERLEDDMKVVKSVPIDGQPNYFKVE